MKTTTWFGLMTGFAAGAYAYSKLTDQQRDAVAERLHGVVDRGRTGEVASSVSNAVGNVADASTERVTDLTADLGERAADEIRDAGSDPVTYPTTVSGPEAADSESSPGSDPTSHAAETND